MPSATLTQAGTLARQLAAMPRRTADDCLAVDETAAAILRTLADGLDDTDAAGIVLTAAADIEACVADMREREQVAERDRARVRARVMRGMAA